MAETEKRPGESIDRVLRRFKRKLKDEGVIDEIKKREFYEKPSETRKKKESAAKRRTRRQQMLDQW